MPALRHPDFQELKIVKNGILFIYKVLTHVSNFTQVMTANCLDYRILFGYLKD